MSYRANRMKDAPPLVLNMIGRWLVEQNEEATFKTETGPEPEDVDPADDGTRYTDPDVAFPEPAGSA